MAKTVNTIMGDFTFDRAQKLRRAHKVADGKDFTFEGEPVVNDFAKYMVELLEGEFDLASED